MFQQIRNFLGSYYDQQDYSYTRGAFGMNESILVLVFSPFFFFSLFFFLLHFLFSRVSSSSSFYCFFSTTSLITKTLFVICAGLCVIVVSLMIAVCFSGNGFWILGSRWLGVLLSVLFNTILYFISLIIFSRYLCKKEEEMEKTEVHVELQPFEPSSTSDIEGLDEEEKEEEETEDKQVNLEEESDQHDVSKINGDSGSKQRAVHHPPTLSHSSFFSHPRQLLLFLLISIFLALIFSLSVEGVCTSFYPVQWTTSFTRLFSPSLCTTASCHVYLLLPQANTSTSMTVVFHSPFSLTNELKEDEGPEVLYEASSLEEMKRETEQERERRGRENFAFRRKAVEEEIVSPFLKRYVSTVLLTDLQPDTMYRFSTGAISSGYSDVFFFRTLPSSTSNEDVVVRIMAGGDMGYNEHAASLLSHGFASEPRPSFFVVGGDLAYDNAICACYHRVDEWLDQLRKSYKDKQLIPLLPIVGNHDAGGYRRTESLQTALYFRYFPYSPLLSYRSHELESVKTIFLALDSDHVSSPGGDQRDWLKEKLQKSTEEEGTVVIAGYHNPMFPTSQRKYEQDEKANNRRYWLPLFDQFDVPLAFEFHNHQYKVTHPLKNGVVVDNAILEEQFSPSRQFSQRESAGTLYVGDGCLGVDAVPLSTDIPSYIRHASSTRHYLLSDIRKTPEGVVSVEIGSFTESGEVFEKVTRTMSLA